MTRKLPTFLAAVFIIITTTRVSDFAMGAMQAGWLGPIFAVALTAGVFVAATYNRVHDSRNGKETIKSEDARKSARNLLYVLVIVETAFNLAEVNRITDFPTGSIEWIGTQIYGVLPSLVVMGLGGLQGKIDALPYRHGKYSISTSFGKLLTSWAENVAGNTPAKIPAKSGNSKSEKAEVSTIAKRHTGGKNGGNTRVRWSELTQEDKRQVMSMKTAIAAKRYGISGRTVRSWRDRIRAEMSQNGHTQIVGQG